MRNYYVLIHILRENIIVLQFNISPSVQFQIFEVVFLIELCLHFYPTQNPPSHIFFPSIAVFFLNGLLIIFHLGFIPFSLFFKSGYELIKDRLGAVEISIVEHLSNDNDDIWKDGTNKMNS